MRKNDYFNRLAKSALRKGKNGNWQKEGYKLHHARSKSVFNVVVSHKGKEVGEATASIGNDGRFIPDGLYVHEDHRRKGLATAMYQKLERLSGKTLEPSEGSSRPAKKLWAQKGRPFGKSDEFKKDPGYHFEVKHYEYSLPMRPGKKYRSTTVTAYHPSKQYSDQDLHRIIGESDGSYRSINDARESFMHPKGGLIGSATFESTPGDPNEGQVGHVHVDESHRRKGIASHVYGLFEQSTGMKVKPSQAQYPDAKALWSQPNRPFGKAERYFASLKKGSLQRRSPFNPKGALTEDQKQNMAAWQGTPSDDRPKHRENLPAMTGNARVRALHKLSGSTKVRRAADGGREFLLHRGMNPAELGSTNDRIDHDHHTSWTPRLDLANNFANPYQKTPGKRVSAWVHENNIHTVPKQFGAVDEEYRAASDSQKNRMAIEHEVIVRPGHKSKLHSVVDAERPTTYAPGRIHDKPVDLDDAINQRGASEKKNRKILGKSELTKAASARKMPKPEIGGLPPVSGANTINANVQFHPKLGRDPKRRSLHHGIDMGQGEQLHTGTITDTQGLYLGRHTNHLGQNVFVKESMPNDVLASLGTKPNRLSTAHREALYHNMAHDFFKMGKYVPETSHFTHNGKEYSAQKWADGYEPYDDQNAAHTEGLGKLFDSDETHKIALMNFVLGNRDRHQGNFLMHPKGKIALIDHGLAFDYGENKGSYRFGYADGVQRQVPFSKEVKKWALQLSPTHFDKHMKENGASPTIRLHALAQLVRLQKNIKSGRIATLRNLSEGHK